MVTGKAVAGANGCKEVVLLAPDLTLMDALAFGSGAYDALGLAGELRSRSEMSLQRVPGPDGGHTLFWQQDQRHRFLSAPPHPFTVFDLPAAQSRPHPSLAHGMIALWGSLGVASNFSADGLAPPHYLLAAAGALGLDFLALADADGDYADMLAFGSAQTPIAIPARHWEAYGNPAPIVDASRIAIPDGIPALLDQRRGPGAPVLLAGNASPPLPGYLEPSPRYTGLAVTSVDLSGAQNAIGERRGWLTNRPGLWLTLVVEVGGSAPVWMGGTLDAANEVTLHIDYGDNYGSGGDIAGLALWQDNRVIQRNDTGLSGGRWSVRVAAVPGTFLYAVATQLDGDFAVTAPIYVRGPTTGRVVLNEVHPLPAGDLNGDGASNGDDEFVELYNPGPAPVALDGWRILLGTGDSERRHTLGPQHILPGGGWLAFWRGHTHLNLDEAGGTLRLVNRDGALVDEFSWGRSPGQARSYSRFPNGSSWFGDTSPTPGGANSGPPEWSNNPPQRNDDADEDDDDDGTLPATYGQATGPPGSLTQSKLAGLRAQVEFRAQVTVPPGLFNSSIYVAEPALDAAGRPMSVGGLGIHVFLYEGEFPPLEVGDWVLLRGVLASFRGEMELRPGGPQDVWRIGPGTPLEPLPIHVREIGESLEGRLVTFTGVISGWQGDSLYLSDPDAPDAPAVRVTVRSSLDWRRPYVQRGEVWSVTGVVNQFAYEPPWNGGYRVLM